MYRNMAMSIPTAIAVRRSVAMVSRAVASHAQALLHESFTRRDTSLQWLMVRTFDRRAAEITGSGINGTIGRTRKKNASTKAAISIPATGVCAPPRTLVDV